MPSAGSLYDNRRSFESTNGREDGCDRHGLELAERGMSIREAKKLSRWMGRGMVMWKCR